MKKIIMIIFKFLVIFHLIIIDLFIKILFYYYIYIISFRLYKFGAERITKSKVSLVVGPATYYVFWLGYDPPQLQKISGEF